MKKRLHKFEGKVEKIKIPDNDVLNWIKTLHEEGFSFEEIDLILKNLNETYKSKKEHSEFSIDKILNELEIYIYKNFKAVIKPKAKEIFKKIIEYFLKENKKSKEETLNYLKAIFDKSFDELK
jgi:DNA-binding transcriptional MerR regulator